MQLEVGLGRRGQGCVFGQQGNHQRALAFCQTGQQGMLGGVQRLQRVGQLRRLGGGDGDRLVAAGVAEQRGDGVDQLAGRLQQRLRVEDFQPVALAVLGADAKGEAEEGCRHGIILFRWPRRPASGCQFGAASAAA